MKKILFLSNSLGLGGSERAMSEMIKRMDLSQYDITVLSLNKSDCYVSFDPRIKIICGVEIFEKLTSPLRECIPTLWKNREILLLIKKTIFSLRCKFNYKKTHISKFFWQTFKREIEKIDEFYDVVIGYGQNTPTYFLKDKVNTNKKIAWLNTDLEKAHYDIKYIRKFYDVADLIVVDSENGKNIIKRIYPDMQNKTVVFPNILDVKGIIEKGEESEEILSCEKSLKILSVGRLVEAKAFHLAVEAAGILRKNNVDFKWYIIGGGNREADLKKQIHDLNLEDSVKLLGAKTNPYKYMKNCDIYVQTSVYEGSCMTVNEAMMFNKPIVSTNFPAIYEKIVDGQNGLVAQMNAVSIAEKVQSLTENEKLRKQFIDYLAKNPIDYDSQMKILDDILT